MIVAQSPFVGPKEPSRPASLRNVPRSAGLWPFAPRARKMPSITAQLTPLARAAAWRLAANVGESRSAGGVGSGSGELSQIVAAPAGPSISGAGAGLIFGRRTARRCAVRARALFAAVLFGANDEARGADASDCRPA